MSDIALAAKPVASSPPGEEELRFIRNFHDVFLSIGIVLFAAGLGLVTSLFFAPIIKDASRGELSGILYGVAAVAFLNAAVMWLIGEVFARGRRLFLPSIVILLAFLAFLYVGVVASYAAIRDLPELFGAMEGAGDFDAVAAQGRSEFMRFILIVAAAQTAGTLAFYLRMRLPFAMGLGMSLLTGTAIVAAWYFAPTLVETRFLDLQLAAGVFMFLLGIVFDARDPGRRTRYSDNAFWLHFFAAPTILGAVTSKVAGPMGPYTGETHPALATLGVVAAFAFVSLLINRRALLVAGLLSAGASIAVLFSKTGLDAGWTAGVTLLTLGFSMVLLGGGWHAARRVVTAPFPRSGPIARIIPPEPRKGEEAADE